MHLNKFGLTTQCCSQQYHRRSSQSCSADTSLWRKVRPSANGFQTPYILMRNRKQHFVVTSDVEEILMV
ncbi:unnamed protein product, partial [Heterobilharzia americana]